MIGDLFCFMSTVCTVTVEKGKYKCTRKGSCTLETLAKSKTLGSELFAKVSSVQEPFFCTLILPPFQLSEYIPNYKSYKHCKHRNTRQIENIGYRLRRRFISFTKCKRFRKIEISLASNLLTVD